MTTRRDPALRPVSFADSTAADERGRRGARLEATPGPRRAAPGAIDLYVNDVRSRPRLAREVEDELAAQAEQGDLEVVRTLVEPDLGEALRPWVENAAEATLEELRDWLDRLEQLDAAVAERRATIASLGSADEAQGEALAEQLAGARAEAVETARSLRSSAERLHGLSGRLDWLRADAVRQGRKVPSRSRLHAARARIAAGERRSAAARAALVESNLKLVVFFANKMRRRGIELPDLIQEGNLGLLRAVQKFERRRGVKFATYAAWWIRENMDRAIIDQSRTVKLPVRHQDKLRRLRRAQGKLTHELGAEPGVDEIAEAVGMPTERVESLIMSSQPIISLDAPVGDDVDNRRIDNFADPNTPAPLAGLAATELDEVLRDAMELLTPREQAVLRLRFGIDEEGDEHTLAEIGRRFEVSRERIRQIESEALAKLRRGRRGQELESFREA